jgi:hypothetical protein
MGTQMDQDGSRGSDVTADLVDTLRALAMVRGHAEVYRTPAGDYRMTGPDCLTGSADNRYVVAKFQLFDAMDALGVRLGQFMADRATAERVAAGVLAGMRNREAMHGTRVEPES